MLNELYQLSRAMEGAGIRGEEWHRKYKLIPRASDKAPCVRILLEGEAVSLQRVSDDKAARLRKYGSNQGTFPAMNLAPLYRVTDEEQKKQLSQWLQQGTANVEIEELKRWCVENNWGSKFRGKLKNSMVDVPAELVGLLSGQPDAPILQMIRESRPFADPDAFHNALEAAAFSLLEQKLHTTLALRVLFYSGDPEKSPRDDFGSLSVILDSRALEDAGMPTVHTRFTQGFNQALLSAGDAEQSARDVTVRDAFGVPFAPLEEPMPSVKLAGGFEATLRTMFKGQPSQYRYGKIENGTYPISPEMRLRLQGALAWAGGPEQKKKTWVNTGKKEVLFAYPTVLPEAPAGYVRLFQRLKNEDEEETTFEAEAARFLDAFSGARKPGQDSNAQRIQIFILRKVDNARTKVVYTYNATPGEIEARSELWSMGRENLPPFRDGALDTLFPLEVPEVLNWVWRQDGGLASNKLASIPRYHGMELFFGDEAASRRDLSVLVQNTAMLALYLDRLRYAPENGDQKHRKQFEQKMDKVRSTLALMGLLLYQVNIRKENYMYELPYLFGQLLQTSDELHLLYCKVMRNGVVPRQLVGSGLYSAAAEAPTRTLGLLGQRMSPYLTWAKTYCAKKAVVNGVEVGQVGRLCWVYQQLANQLSTAWTPDARFSDADKAQLFLGFLAQLPKKDSADNSAQNKQTEGDTENG